MKQKLLKLLLATLVVVTLTACNSKTTQEEANATTVQNPTTTETTVDTSVDTDTSTDDDNTVTGTETTGGGDSADTTPQTQADTTPPVLTLNGKSNVTLEQGTVYTELGATATDAVDGTVSVSIGGSVDTSIEGTYNMTYTAMDSSGNGASMSRSVNVEEKVNKIKTLTLTRPETYTQEIVRIYYTKIPLKVMATYQDGQSEEVTDIVTWDYKDKKKIKCFDRGRCLIKSHYFDDATLWASLDGVTSNTLYVPIEKLANVNIIHTPNESYPNRNVTIEVTLTKKPTADVILKLKLKKEDNISFSYDASSDLNKEIIFGASEYYYKETIKIYDPNRNNNDIYTIITEPFVSEDPFYDGKNLEDIVVKKKTSFKLIEPLLKERKGAIRGVSINFRVFADKKDLKYELVNPPKGMSINSGGFISDYEYDDDYLEYLEGCNITWNVPIEIKEKIYDITVKSTDLKGKTEEITFPIKVPKTKPIQTEIINNELIVTDKNSNLYGMKMKGHSGEDISELRLRSVEYGDVWKKRPENRKPEDIVDHVVFILEDMPNALDVKMPEWMDTYDKAKILLVSFSQYSGSRGEWKGAVKGLIKYENDDGYLYRRGHNIKRNIFMLMPEKAQYKGNNYD